MNEKPNSTQLNILKSTGIIGLSQVIIVIIGIIRTKIVAVLLGSLGVGYLGLYQSIIDLVKSLTGFGLSFSAVRNVSSANSENDLTRLSKVITIVKSWVWFTGLLGTVVMFVFSDVLSYYTFGNYIHSDSIKILSIALLIVAITGGQLVILQGLRQISSIAKSNVFGAIAGLFISLPLYYFFGIDGVLPSILLSSIVALIFSWFFAHKIKILKLKLSLRETVTGGFGMVKLGLFSVITGFVSTGTMYLVRVFIANETNINKVGLFQAAWTLSSLYLSMVLNAMIADYYPALCAVNNDNEKVNEAVNHQTEIVLLISTPIIVGMLVFLPLMVQLLYTTEFLGMISLLQWQIAGDFFKIIAWPIGVILLAKGKGGYLIITEISWNLIYLLSIFFGWQYFGLEITGISFFIGYMIYVLIVFIAVQPICKFRWNHKILKLLSVYFPIVLLTFLNVRYVEGIWKFVFGLIVFLITSVYSFNKINKILDIRQLALNLKNKIFKNSK